MPLFAFVFPILAAAGVRHAWTLRTRDRPAALTLAVLLGSALWVLAAVLLIDGEEANRMRFSTQLALWIGAAAAVEASLRRRAAAAGSAPTYAETSSSPDGQDRSLDRARGASPRR